jgi:hypothetical protein
MIMVMTSGNVYITGFFQGSNVDFAPGGGTAYLSSDGGSADIYFAKYNSSGECQWAHKIGGSSDDKGYGIVIDGSGNVYITGFFKENNVDFDPSTGGTANLSSNGDDDIYFAKYNSSGEYQWAHNIGGSSNDHGYGIVLDGSSNVYITGYFQETVVDFDPVGTANLSSAGGSDIYFAKYNSSGQYQWAHNIGGSSDDQGYGIATDGSSNVLITGYFQGSNVNFDPVGTANLSSTGGSDIYFAKYNSSGVYQWAFDIGNSGDDYGYSIATDGSSNVVITGNFKESNVDFDPGAGTHPLSSAGGSDIYFAKYNSSGVYQWAHDIGDSSDDFGYDIAADGSGNVYITGSFQGSTVDFDPGAGTVNLDSHGSYDIYYAKYNSNGIYQWAHNLGSASSDDFGYGIAVDGSGYVYITGYFYGENVDFDPGTGTAYLNSNGNYDIYFGKYFASDGTLPVELSSFTAQFINNTPTLCWTTQSETNNLGWNIYRSISQNLGQAIQINTVLIPGSGTTTEPTEYIYEDEYETEYGETYWYWLESRGSSSLTEIYGPITLTIPEEGTVPDLPKVTTLKYNFPNPFNPSTTISFDIKEGEVGTLSIYNIKGQVLESREFSAGIHDYEWFADDYDTGIYFYKLESSSHSEVKKMLILK